MTGRILFWSVFFVANTVQAITGFAGGLFISPVGIRVFGLENNVAIICLVGIFACSFVVVTSWKDVLWREVTKICVVMVVFIGVGFWLGQVLTIDWLFRIFGIFVLAVGVKNLFFVDMGDLPEWALYLVLIGAGITQGMYACGGAFLVIYALQKFRDKLNFRATMSAVWTVLNILYFAFLAFNGHANQTVIEVSAVCVPIAFITTYIGTKLAHRINQEAFLKVVYVLLILIGISALLTA